MENEKEKHLDITGLQILVDLIKNNYANKDIEFLAKELEKAIDTHTKDKNAHVSEEEKITWNNKSNFSGNYEDLNNKPNEYQLPTASSETLGGVKVGENLEITPEGILNALGGEENPYFKILEGTDEIPVNLNEIQESGIYIISGVVQNLKTQDDSKYTLDGIMLLLNMKLDNNFNPAQSVFLKNQNDLLSSGSGCIDTAHGLVWGNRAGFTDNRYFEFNSFSTADGSIKDSYDSLATVKFVQFMVGQLISKNNTSAGKSLDNLNTENKESIYDAINELKAKIDDLETKVTPSE